MRNVTSNNLVQDYLAAKFPNQYVVILYCDTDTIVVWDNTINALREFGEDYVQSMIINENVMIHCDSYEEAMQVFKKFPEEEFGYCMMWGPIEKRTLTKEFYERLLKAHPKGAILTENT